MSYTRALVRASVFYFQDPSRSRLSEEYEPAPKDEVVLSVTSDRMKLLPMRVYAFLDALIAKLHQDAEEEDLPDDAKQELRNWAANVRTLRRTCRERDALLGAIREADLEKARSALQAAAIDD